LALELFGVEVFLFRRKYLLSESEAKTLFEVNEELVHFDGMQVQAKRSGLRFALDCGAQNSATMDDT
jgi:hypothetical protein